MLFERGDRAYEGRAHGMQAEALVTARELGLSAVEYRAALRSPA
jgi:hypothetical protein